MKWFIEAMIDVGALWMSADETVNLRIGRRSPYCFNTDDLCSGKSMELLARGYALRIVDAGLDDFAIYCPVFRGHVLATAIALTLWREYRHDVEFAIDSSEERRRSEKERPMRSPLEDKFVVIVDDEITDASTKYGAFEFVQARGGIPKAIVVAFDRMERMSACSAHSVLWQLRADLGIPIYSVVTVKDLLAYLQASGLYAAEQTAIERYLHEYGADE
jgi:orotate phosphoribosyltransferase